MKNKKCIILMLIIVIFTNFLSIKIISSQPDTDYKKLGLEIEDYDIDYCTIYVDDIFGVYKVYKINDHYAEDSIDHIEEQLKNSQLWSKNKFYEYMMMKFYDIQNNRITEIDREDLYYYYNNGIYAIIDVKNAKLYYYDYIILDGDEDENEIFGIEIDNYIAKEVYGIKGGWQGDGLEYFTYQFTEEKGEEIEKILAKSEDWNKEKLDDKVIDCFKYNSEVFEIQNGYYHYKLVCRTSDDYKKEHFTPEEATGSEVGVYDIDTNMLYYYYWTY